MYKRQLLAEDATEQESIDTVFQYVTQHVTYDEDKAATVETGYLPDIDETLSLIHISPHHLQFQLNT